jgi:hypothetical protein
MLNIEAVYHYFKDDVDCSSDYTSIDVYFDDELKHSFGDHYHDKGREKLEGILLCLNLLGIEYGYRAEMINDY